jgi:hypothetical protein
MFLSIDILSQLKALNLFGMATALAELQAALLRKSLTPTVLYSISSMPR